MAINVREFPAVNKELVKVMAKRWTVFPVGQFLAIDGTHFHGVIGRVGGHVNRDTAWVRHVELSVATIVRYLADITFETREHLGTRDN